MDKLKGEMLLELKSDSTNLTAFKDGFLVERDGKTKEIPLDRIFALYKNEADFFNSDNISVIIKYNKKDKLVLAEKDIKGVIEFFEELLLNHWTNIYKDNSDTMKWINGCTAILNMQCYWDQNIFGGFEKTAFIKWAKKTVLKRTWGVKKRRQLDEVLNSLLNARSVQNYYEVLENNGLEQIDDNIYFECAWDLQRVIFVSSLGYLAGYMTKNEALDISLNAAKEIQKIFTDWNHFNTSYLVGHMLWFGVGFEVEKSMPYTRKKIYDYEKNRKYNPWLVDWNTELKKEW